MFDFECFFAWILDSGRKYIVASYRKFADLRCRELACLSPTIQREERKRLRSKECEHLKPRNKEPAIAP